MHAIPTTAISTSYWGSPAANLQSNSYINNNFVLDLGNIFLIILSIILFIILIFINKDFYKNYDKELENIMTQYKEEREKMQCKDVEDKK